MARRYNFRQFLQKIFQSDAYEQNEGARSVSSYLLREAGLLLLAVTKQLLQVGSPISIAFEYSLVIIALTNNTVSDNGNLCQLESVLEAGLDIYPKIGVRGF